MRTAVISVLIKPEGPKVRIISGVIHASVITIPTRKLIGEKDPVHKAIKAVIQKVIKPLNTAPTFTVKIASARITAPNT